METLQVQERASVTRLQGREEAVKDGWGAESALPLIPLPTTALPLKACCSHVSHLWRLQGSGP